VQALLSPSNARGIPPLPKSLLVNDGKSADYKFEKGKRYRFRVINYAAFASAMIHFDSHDLNVIMNDASYIEKEKALQLRVTPAQRFDFIIEATKQDNRNYPFLVSLDQNRDWTNPRTTPPISWPFNITGYLIMDTAGDRPKDVVGAWTPSDDSHFKPLATDGHDTELLPSPDKTIVLDFTPCLDKFGIPRYVDD
jgi:iron transport multicopper oxidase